MTITCMTNLDATEQLQRNARFYLEDMRHITPDENLSTLLPDGRNASVFFSKDKSLFMIFEVCNADNAPQKAGELAHQLHSLKKQFPDADVNGGLSIYREQDENQEVVLMAAKTLRDIYVENGNRLEGVNFIGILAPRYLDVEGTKDFPAEGHDCLTLEFDKCEAALIAEGSLAEDWQKHVNARGRPLPSEIDSKK